MAYVYNEHEMIYKDYKTTARADGDNPYYRNGSDHTELNRTEKYEVLYFINHLLKILWKTSTPGKAEAQKLEKMIRVHPSNIRSHKRVEQWIVDNWGAY